MSDITALYVSAERKTVPGVRTRSGLPGSSVTIGAASALPRLLAMASPVTRRTLLCLPVVRYGPFSSMPPVRISAVVFPALIRSRTSIIVRSSIQIESCMSMGRGMPSTSTRGCWFTEAVGREGGCCAARASRKSTAAAMMTAMARVAIVRWVMGMIVEKNVR